MELQHKSSARNDVSQGTVSVFLARNLHRAKDLLDSARTSLSSAADKLVSFAVECLENMPAKFASAKQMLLYSAVLCLALNVQGCSASFDANTSSTRDASAQVVDAAEEDAIADAEEEEDSPEVTITDATEEDQAAIDAALDAEAGMDAAVDADASLDAADADADEADVVLPRMDITMPPDVRPPVDAADVADQPDVTVPPRDVGMDAVDEEVGADVPVPPRDAGVDALDVVDIPDVPDVPDVIDRPDAGMDVPSIPDVPSMPDSGPDVRDVASEPEVGGATSCGPCVDVPSRTVAFRGNVSQDFGTFRIQREMNRDRFSIFCLSGGAALQTNCFAGSPSGVCMYTNGAATVTIRFERFDPAESGIFFENVSVLCR